MKDGNENGTGTYSATVDDVAAEFGVSRRTVFRWIKKGCPHKRPAGGQARFSLDEVNEWAEPAEPATEGAA